MNTNVSSEVIAFQMRQDLARCMTINNTLPLCFRKAKKVGDSNRYCLKQTLINLRIMGVDDQMMSKCLPESVRKTLINREGKLRQDLQ